MAVPGALFLLRSDAIVPRSVLLLDPALLLLMMGGSRFGYRAWKDHRLGLTPADTQPVIVLGAGLAADTLLRELFRTGGPWRVAGLLDDDPALKGRHLHGIPVLGGLHELTQHARRLQVRQVIMALPSAPHELRRRLSETCVADGLTVQTVPALDDLISLGVTMMYSIS